MDKCYYCGKPFAEFYDSVWKEDPYADNYYEFVMRCIEKYNPNAKSILELAVGTGNVLGKFSPEKFELHGLDISEDYLQIVEKKHPHIKYYRQDMSKFRISKKFDVIFLIFDAINYLMDFSKWESLFERVKNHLNIHGLFIFNAYSIKALRDLKKREDYSITRFKKGIMFDKPTIIGNVLIWESYLFERISDHKYLLHKYKSRERIFNFSRVKKPCLNDLKYWRFWTNIPKKM